MPLYQYRCVNNYCSLHVANYTWESYRYNFSGRDRDDCPKCGEVGERAHDKEIPIIRPDIEPGYNISIGENVGSRRELREHMAIHNAASDDMLINSYPSDGRLVKEERAEFLSKKAGKKSISGFDVVTEGVANYQEIRDYAKEYKRKGAR